VDGLGLAHPGNPPGIRGVYWLRWGCSMTILICLISVVLLSPMVTLTSATARTWGSVERQAEPIVLEGRGQQLTRPVRLEAGLVVVTLTHDGRRNFIAQLVSGTGQTVDYLANVIGPLDGSKAIGLREGGEYAVNVDADGGWRIQLRQPPAIAETDSRVFAGAGPAATPLFSLAAGLRRVTFTHTGGRNFIVQLLDATDGRTLDYVTNVIGPADGSQGVQIRQAGVFIFTVEADGPWTLAVE
jgi:hypothetical protein